MCSPKNVVDDFKNAARQLLSEGKHMGPETEHWEDRDLVIRNSNKNAFYKNLQSSFLLFILK